MAGPLSASALPFSPDKVSSVGPVQQAQLHNTLRLMPALLVWSLVLVLATLTFALLYHPASLVAVLAWSGTGLTGIAIAFVFLKKLQAPTTLPVKKADMFIYGLAIGLALLYDSSFLFFPGFPAFNSVSRPEVVNAVWVFGTLGLFTALVALLCLTEKFNYFIVNVTVSAVFLAVLQIFQPSLLSGRINAFYITADIYTVFLISIGYLLYRIRLASTTSSVTSQDMASTAQARQQATEANRAELEKQLARRLSLQQQLEQRNQSLEEKVSSSSRALATSNASLAQSASTLEMAHQIAGLATWEWDLGSQSFHSDSLEQLLGYTEQERNSLIAALPNSLVRLMHPDDLPHFKQQLFDYFKKRTPRFECEYRIKHKNGQWVWLKDVAQASRWSEDGAKVLGMVGISRNITRERLDADNLKLSAQVFNKASEGIFILNADMEYVSVNPKYLEILGYRDSRFIGQRAFDAGSVNQENIRQNYELITQLLNTYGEFDGEILDYHQSGKEVLVWLHITSITDSFGRLTNFVGIITDLTQRKMDHERLSYVANYDAITQLPNRNLFNSTLHQLIQMTQAQEESGLALLVLDIDRFKVINESLGTEVADQLLQGVAQRIGELETRMHLTARLGGNTFALLIDYDPNTPIVLEAECQRLIRKFHKPFPLLDQEVTITISVGVALYPQHGRQVDMLAQSAEQALKEAKGIGGNTYRIATNSPTSITRERIVQENELRRALLNDEIVPFFQPKYHLQTGEITGFEALARWHHPKLGIRSPFHFIPLAEEMGLISAIGEVILRKSCQQLKIWEKAGYTNISVAVNVDAQQFSRGQFLSVLDEIVSQWQVRPDMLELEITEGTLMDTSDRILDMLSAIKDRGNRIALDDFGTGYSSLSYLSRYPIDVLKIDKSFIDGVGVSDRKEGIVNAIIAMAQALQLKVVCEGVETQAQAAYVQAQGCEMLQGYYVSPPLSPEAATTFLEQHYFAPFMIQQGQEKKLYS